MKGRLGTWSGGGGWEGGIVTTIFLFWCVCVCVCALGWGGGGRGDSWHFLGRHLMSTRIPSKLGPRVEHWGWGWPRHGGYAREEGGGRPGSGGRVADAVGSWSTSRTPGPPRRSARRILKILSSARFLLLPHNSLLDFPRSSIAEILAILRERLLRHHTSSSTLRVPSYRPQHHTEMAPPPPHSPLAALAALAATAHLVSTASAASFCDPSNGWTLEWEDDFSGDSLDLSSWTPLTSDGGGNIGSCRDAYCTPANVAVANGTLILTSKQEQMNGYNYTTGAVNTSTKRSWKPVPKMRLCFSAILPGYGQGAPHAGAGIWPAGWMMPDVQACWVSSSAWRRPGHASCFARGSSHPFHRNPPTSFIRHPPPHPLPPLSTRAARPRGD